MRLQPANPDPGCAWPSSSCISAEHARGRAAALGPALYLDPRSSEAIARVPRLRHAADADRHAVDSTVRGLRSCPPPRPRSCARAASPLGHRAARRRTQESMFQDDNLLVYDDAERRGADAGHASRRWASTACASRSSGGSWRPADQSTQKPGLRRRRPGRVPARRNWDRYDRIVRLAPGRRGIGVNFNLTVARSPLGGRATPRARRHRGEPSTRAPREFGLFVRAWARATAASSSPRGPLPRVDYWSIWNEPNQARLADAAVEPRTRATPSARSRRRRAIYRVLVDAAYDGAAGDRPRRGHDPDRRDRAQGRSKRRRARRGRSTPCASSASCTAWTTTCSSCRAPRPRCAAAR